MRNLPPGIMHSSIPQDEFQEEAWEYWMGETDYPFHTYQKYYGRLAVDLDAIATALDKDIAFNLEIMIAFESYLQKLREA